MYTVYINDNWKKGIIVNSFEDLMEQIEWTLSTLGDNDKIHISNDITNEDVTEKALKAKQTYDSIMNQIGNLRNNWE